MLVTWYDAAAYAAWLGGSLPTEAQWEFTARGQDGRRFPWGGEMPTARCDRANFDQCRPQGLKPVKAGRDAGRTREGVYDLAGNVSEWSRNWYHKYPSEPQPDPLGPSTGPVKVLRGGTYRNNAEDVRAAARGTMVPDSRGRERGFRVAWSLAAQ